MSDSIHYNDGFDFEALIGLAIVGGIWVAAVAWQWWWWFWHGWSWQYYSKYRWGWW
jgi:hypothetical protein